MTHKLDRKDLAYREIAEILCAEIREGRYAKEHSFPSLTTIMRRFGCSRGTVVKSVEELKRRGVVKTVSGSGIFVTRRGSANKIGLIVPGVAVTDFFKPVVSELNRLARKYGYQLVFGEVWSDNHEGRIQQTRDLAAEFIRGNIAGVIYEPLAGKTGDEINAKILELFTKKQIPAVLLDCDIVQFPERSAYDVVGVNDFESGARIARHLLDVGAKNVHFLVGSLFPTTFANRLSGAESMLALASKTPWKGPDILYAEADDLAALKKYLENCKRRPDAFICSNDVIASVFKQTLEKAGLRVPQDIMLTGFADLPVASLMTPPLTTVRQDRVLMARTAFRRLLERIRNPSLSPCDIFLPAPLIIRGSTMRLE